MKPEDDDDHQPADESLTTLDRRLRRDRLMRRIQELGGRVGGLHGEPTETELDFLERIVTWEEGPFSTHRAWLAQRGAEFLPPAELDDASLARELWRLIEALADAQVVLRCTDHLNDRELYEEIGRKVLPAECVDLPRSKAEIEWWDMADPGADGGAIWLRYYATKSERRDWQREFPTDPLPPRCRPPRRRDHRLPGGGES